LDRFLYAAKVRNGFVVTWQRLRAYGSTPARLLTAVEETDAVGFDLGREMKNCVWLKPVLVAQIEFTEWTPDGHLRHSKFVGLRGDKAAGGVLRET
jgi:ATP-dependent DNA ligase